MIDDDRKTTVVSTPSDAVEQFVGDQFIDWLMDFITHEVQNWSEIQQIIDSEYRAEKIKKFMLQKYLEAKALWGGKENDPGFLGFAIANLSEVSDPTAERVLELIEQRNTEEKKGLSENLWIKFLKKLGLSQEEIDNTEPKEPTRIYVSALSEVYSSFDWKIAIGAFVAYQRIIMLEAKALLEVLKNNLDFSNSDLEIFRAYSEENKKLVINPRALLAQIVVDKESKEMVMEGVIKQLSARKSYYEKVMKYLE